MLRQAHKRYDACMDIRYTESFFYVSKVGWNDRFWNWYKSSRLDYNQPKTHAVLEGRGHNMTATRRFSYSVSSTESYVPIMLLETPRFAGHYEAPKFYVLDQPHESSLLREHVSMVWEALQSPIPRDFELVSVEKMGQLARAGSTARWVANKMAGKYDGEEI